MDWGGQLHAQITLLLGKALLYLLKSQTGLDCFGEEKNLALVWNVTKIHWSCSHRLVLHKYIYTTCLYSERKPHSQFLYLYGIH